MTNTLIKFMVLSEELKADAAALRRDGVYRCCAGTYEYAAAHIDAIVRESDAQVPVAATLDEAAADPALTLDVARELLRDAAAGIRSLAARELLAERDELRVRLGAITHCDNCGCDWLDNGLNPVGCPYCKQTASVDEAKEADLWRCTVCGRVGTVGRCCGEETRERANMEQLLADAAIDHARRVEGDGE